MTHIALYGTDFAEKYRICKSLIAKWKLNWVSLENAVTHRHKRTIKKDQTFIKAQRFLRKLHQKFKNLKISYAWYYANANKINKEIRGKDAKRLPKSVVSCFINASKMSSRVEFNESDNQRKSIICLLLCSGTVFWEKRSLKQASFAQLWKKVGKIQRIPSTNISCH